VLVGVYLLVLDVLCGYDSVDLLYDAAEVRPAQHLFETLWESLRVETQGQAVDWDIDYVLVGFLALDHFLAHLVPHVGPDEHVHSCVVGST